MERNFGLICWVINIEGGGKVVVVQYAVQHRLI